MKPKIANLDQWWQGSVEIAQKRSFGTRIKNGLIGFAYLSAVGLTATMWLGCGGGKSECEVCIEKCQQENPGINRADCLPGCPQCR